MPKKVTKASPSVCMKVITDNHYEVNICDKELIGTKINDTTISEHFYGTIADKNKIIEQLKLATLINAMGKEAVKLAQEVKGELQVLEVKGIPYTQFYTIL